MRNTNRTLLAAGLAGAMLLTPFLAVATSAEDSLQAAFDTPPQAAKPWVYWYFMDGYITREGLTADLEAMKKAGIGGAIFLTINVGVPKPPHPVEFMSPEWQDLYAYMIKEADRLGIAISLGVGPGWSGDGGPWLKPEETMQDLVASVTPVTGGKTVDVALPQPSPREPYFGRSSLASWMVNTWLGFYRDVCVVAYPTPKPGAWVPFSDEKALYYRAPYSSAHNVRPFFDAPADVVAVPTDACLDRSKMIDLTDKLDKDGRLRWDAPPGEWTIYRFGRTLTGQNTRPSPTAGLGFESDKFSAAAFAAHAKAFLQPLIDRAGKPSGPGRGLTTLHLDSWEMGSQNWTEDFRQQFQKRRGYDPLPYLPALLGKYVTDAATTERFLWDIRQTGRELVHDGLLIPLRDYAHAHGLRFTCEGYDMNPAGDLMVLGTADVQMGEFWSKGFGFRTEFSIFEATSAAHTKGQPLIGAESFTAGSNESWHQYPAVMKHQGDWAFAAGVNWFVIHRYQHQPSEGEFPGMRMGHWGVSWERTQTWWDMVPAYHEYLTRTSAVLQCGVPVADVLYLAPEGAPHVFRPPVSATIAQGDLPDRRGYNFDGVDPDRLMEATVTNGRVTFPGGASYAVLVLPKYDTMTLPLLNKVKALLDDGATVIGERPLRTPGLGTQGDDATLAALSADMWKDIPAKGKAVGHGLLVNDPAVRPAPAVADPLMGAKWVGLKPTAGSTNDRYFEAKLKVPLLENIESAELFLRASGPFHIKMNAQDIGDGPGLQPLSRLDVTTLAKPGDNVLNISVKRADDTTDPIGLIGALIVHTRDGRILALRSNASWLSSPTAGGAMTKSEALTDLPAAWPVSTTTLKYDDLYVPYDVTAGLLQSQGLPPDFEADVPMRYTHRRDGDDEIYFIANPSDAAVDAACTFRITGRAPQWWDPVNDQRRALPQYRDVDGRTTLTLHLEAGASGFVVFRRVPVTASAGTGNNARREQLVQTITGPWDVAFEPKWGGPAAVKFDTLEDWSKRPEPGIHFYSGQAVYRTSFDAASKANVLSLSDVHAMARVKLNGRDLGVVWCAPWSIDLPSGLLRPTGNDLQITVANLWINRLIGDAALPQDQRLTKTTSNPYKANDPLQPSGLLGPVQLRLRAD